MQKESLHFYCTCRIEIELEYYEKEEGIMTKDDSCVVSAGDSPLRDMLMRCNGSLLEVRHIDVVSHS